MKGHPIKHEDSLRFILAGKATVTFLNTQTDNRFTYKIKKSKDSSIYFVSVLTNPDVYQYIGIINSEFQVGRKSSDAQSIRVFKYVFFKLKSNTLPDFIEIWHEGKCGRCGRKLTVPKSIKTGMGPECSKFNK